MRLSFGWHPDNYEIYVAGICPPKYCPSPCDIVRQNKEWAQRLRRAVDRKRRELTELETMLTEAEKALRP